MLEFVPAPELERLPGEPARWHERFVSYALMPPVQRSVLAVYRAEVEQAQKGRKSLQKNVVRSPAPGRRRW